MSWACLMSFHDSKDSGEIIKAVEQAGSLNSLLRTILLDTAPVLFDLAIAFWYITYLLDAYATIIVIYVAVSFTFVTYVLGIVMKRSQRVWPEKTVGKQGAVRVGE